MIHPTDEELDALVKRLDNLFAMLEEEGYYTKANTAAFARKAITSLSAQLAAANARADLAEAALAAQIEADAGVVDQMFYNSATDDDFSDDTSLTDWAGWATIGQLRKCSSEAIRNQPHDRTALDRMLAEHEVRLREAREISEAKKIATRNKAVRELAETIRGWRNDVPMTGDECANAILALIDSEQPKENMQK